MDSAYVNLVISAYFEGRKQRRLGEIIKRVWRQAADSALPVLIGHLGDEAEAIRICEQTKKEQAEGNIHAYMKMYTPSLH